jgi:hypothetical protein
MITRHIDKSEPGVRRDDRRVKTGTGSGSRLVGVCRREMDWKSWPAAAGQYSVRVNEARRGGCVSDLSVSHRARMSSLLVLAPIYER